jgi:hypothetical protein
MHVNTKHIFNGLGSKVMEFEITYFFRCPGCETKWSVKDSWKEPHEFTPHFETGELMDIMDCMQKLWPGSLDKMKETYDPVKAAEKRATRPWALNIYKGPIPKDSPPGPSEYAIWLLKRLKRGQEVE